MTRCDDYCCNHGCNQGRDCPAGVARIGQRFPKEAVPLRPAIPNRRKVHRMALTVIGALYLTAAFCFAVAAYA